MPKSTWIILGIFACAILFCLYKIISILYINRQDKLRAIRTDAYNSAVMAETAKWRTSFFSKCQLIRDAIVEDEHHITVAEFLRAHSLDDPRQTLDKLLESITRYVLSHEYCSDALIDIFCAAGLFRLLLICDQPAVKRKAGNQEPWFKYTTCGAQYPQDVVTRFLGSMEMSERYRLDRLYYFIDSLLYDTFRLEEFMNGQWLRYDFDKDIILHELESRPHIPLHVEAAMNHDTSKIELRHEDIDNISKFITGFIISQTD